MTVRITSVSYTHLDVYKRQIVMWFFIMRDQNPVMEVTYIIPVQVQNLNSGYIIEDAPDVVRVVLAGPRDTIMSMKSDNLRAYICLLYTSRCV